MGNKQFVVLDGTPQRHYDAIGRGSLAFSPDSKRLAYAARLGTHWFVVVDGRETKQYDAVITARSGGRILYDSADRLRYLVQRNTPRGFDIYRVEETV